MSDNKGKDSLMKMLLSSGPVSGGHSYSQPPRLETPTSSIPSPLSDNGDDSYTMLSTYLNQVNVARQCDAPNLWVNIDHNYARSGNESSDGSFAKPTKTLFMSKPTPLPTDDTVDVVTEPVLPTPPYDLTKANQVMDECETYVSFARLDNEASDDWEDTLPKIGWTAAQSSLFDKVVKVLHADRLARLALSGTKNEPVLRRVSVDKSSQRFREMMAAVSWDTRLTQWLHTVLVENLGTSYLAAYLDILQTLKMRIPTLVEKMMAANTHLAKLAPVVTEGLNLLLKRPWDPAASCINQHKLRRLPNNPVIIMVPSGLKRPHQLSPRAHLWTSHLSSLASVVNCSTALGHLSPRLTVFGCLEQLTTTVKAKIAEVRADYPNRPMILVGWRSGAALALQVALTEPATAVVCLGFSVSTVEGSRGEPDDSLLNIQCPVLFVTGENAACARPDDLEDLREKLHVQTGLLVVGAADDCLRMGKTKKRTEGVTQGMVDRCVLEEVGDFLAGVLMSPAPSGHRPTPAFSHASRGGFLARERKRHNSTTSSVDSESSTAKRSRPGTPQQLQQSQQHHMNGSVKPGMMGVRMGSVRGRRPGSGRRGRRSMGLMHSHLNSAKAQAQVSQLSTPSGITVNIGSLASLSGPICMTPSANSTAVPAIKLQQASRTVQLVPATAGTGCSVVDAAPPEEVMPTRDAAEPEHKRPAPPHQPSMAQVVHASKTPTRLIMASGSSSAPHKNSAAAVGRLSLPVQTATPGSEERKHQTPTPTRLVQSSPRPAQVARTTTIQLLNKQGKLGPRPVGRPVGPLGPRTPAIIKTTPGARPATQRSQFNKLVASSGTNIILLSDSGSSPGKPVILPIVGSSSKMGLQNKMMVQKQSQGSPAGGPKPVQAAPKTPPTISKLLMAKKFLPTTSILQRPLLRGRGGLAARRQPRDDGRDQEDGEVMKLPLIFTEDGEAQAHGTGHPVVIPIVDSTRSKGLKSQDIAYAEDGDSISFPLDIDLGEALTGAEEQGTLQVVVGSPVRGRGRPLKSQQTQYYMTKPDASGLRKVKALTHVKRLAVEDSMPDTKYLINYQTIEEDDDDTTVTYEIVEEDC